MPRDAIKGAADNVVKRGNAIRRMNQLLEQVSGFDSEPRIPREELHERADSGCVIGEATLS